jgi:hypothetical protein
MRSQLCSAALCRAILSLAVIASASTGQAASSFNSSKSNVYRTVSTDAEKAACVNAAGVVVILNGKQVCQTAEAGGSGPEPQEGITITGCTPSASGDPMKGLNVSKGGTSSGGQLCP